MVKSEKIKPNLIKSPKGMHDVLPEEQPFREKFRRAAREVAECYNFSRIDTPILEPAELFERSVGQTSDIVEKQLFIVQTKSKECLALRPEGTAAVARAFVEHTLSQLGSPLKLYYDGQFFRYEQPQAGRTREFHQVGFEILSVNDDPIYDAQILLTASRFLEVFRLKNLNFLINSIGCKNCRPEYRRELQTYYKTLRSRLCVDCVRRYEMNPLRLLDCKVPECRALREDAPIIVDHLCSQCDAHFKAVLEYLDELNIPYALDHHLVRGLDYYTKTVFEIVAGGFEASLLGGGRYDYLVEFLGGKPTAGVGWAASAERILAGLRAQGINIQAKSRPKVFLIYIGDLAKRRSLKIIEELHKAGIGVDESLGKESLKAQLRAADKVASPIALIFGQREAFEESIIIRDLKTGLQETMPLKRMVEVIKKKLKG